MCHHFSPFFIGYTTISRMKIPTVASSTFGRMLKVWLAAAAWDAQHLAKMVVFFNGDYDGVRNIWQLPHFLNVKPWFFNVWHGLTMRNLRNHGIDRDSHLVKKNSGLTIKFGWNKCGLSMWRIHCENLHATGNLCIYLSIDLSTYLSIYLVISYRTSYLSLYL